MEFKTIDVIPTAFREPSPEVKELMLALGKLASKKVLFIEESLKGEKGDKARLTLATRSRSAVKRIENSDEYHVKVRENGVYVARD